MAAEKRFGNFALAADFTIAGEQIGIFGESGSGKSTLVGLLAGIHQPDQGEIFLDGECLFSSTERESMFQPSRGGLPSSSSSPTYFRI